MVHEIEDRFGSLPKGVLNLISIIKIRIGLKKLARQGWILKMTA